MSSLQFDPVMKHYGGYLSFRFDVAFVFVSLFFAPGNTMSAIIDDFSARLIPPEKITQQQKQ